MLSIQEACVIVEITTGRRLPSWCRPDAAEWHGWNWSWQNWKSVWEKVKPFWQAYILQVWCDINKDLIKKLICCLTGKEKILSFCCFQAPGHVRTHYRGTGWISSFLKKFPVKSLYFYFSKSCKLVYNINMSFYINKQQHRNFL